MQKPEGKWIIGIDPGLDGGIAAYDGLNLIFHQRMPVIKYGTKRVLNIGRIVETLNQPEIQAIVLEKVHSMPKQGVASTFKFGENYGVIKGVSAGIGKMLVEVTPQEWKKSVIRGVDLALGKKMSVAFCCNMFSKENLTDGEADAACMAVWGWKFLAF